MGRASRCKCVQVHEAGAFSLWCRIQRHMVQRLPGFVWALCSKAVRRQLSLGEVSCAASLQCMLRGFLFQFLVHGGCDQPGTVNQGCGHSTHDQF